MIVEHGQQGRALAAGGYIATPKVADHRDTGHLDQRIRIAYLPGEG